MPPSPTRKVPGKGPDTTAPGPGLQTLQLALQSAAVFDVPTRTRRVILVGGLVGVVLIAVASLISGEAARIKADKIIHFTGYATLAVVLVLGLRPTLYVPGLIALVGLGFGIEYLQPFMGRDLEASADVSSGSILASERHPSTTGSWIFSSRPSAQAIRSRLWRNRDAPAPASLPNVAFSSRHIESDHDMVGRFSMENPSVNIGSADLKTQPSPRRGTVEAICWQFYEELKARGLGGALFECFLTPASEHMRHLRWPKTLGEYPAPDGPVFLVWLGSGTPPSARTVDDSLLLCL